MKIQKIIKSEYRNGVIAVCAALALIVAFNCAGRTPVKMSYDALTGLGVTYDVLMTTGADMHRGGLIPDKDWTRIKGYARLFHDAYHPAVDAVKLMKKGEDPEGDVTELIIEASKLFGQLLETASEYIDEEGRARL